MSAHSDPREYLQHVMKATNMSCLTPEGAISGDCDFLSANMYARSLFGALCDIFMYTTQVDGLHQVRMLSPISVLRRRKQVVLLDMYAFVAKLRVLLCRWAIG